MSISITTIATALDVATAVIATTNQTAAIEIGTRRDAFTAMIQPIVANLLSEVAAAGNQETNQTRVASAEMQDAIEGFTFEVQAIQTASDRVIFQSVLSAAVKVAAAIVQSTAFSIGVEAVLAMI